jgi:hypothetical protein
LGCRPTTARRSSALRICSAKMSAEHKRDEIDEVAAGEREIRKLFSGLQEQLILEHAPTEVSWADLSVLGPVQVRKWKIDPKGFGDEVVAEEWTLPERSDLIELSIKVEPERAQDASETFMAVPRGERVHHRGRPADQDPGHAHLLHGRTGIRLSAASRQPS